MGFNLKRRELLKMAGGAALAVPVLELTHAQPARAGGGIPKRYVFIYAGMSTGRGGAGEQITPAATGMGYDLPRSLHPLGTQALSYGGSGFDVQDEVSVISGLTVPWANAAGQTPPPGGRSPEFHYNTVGPIASGVAGLSDRTNRALGETNDQIVARHIADKNHRHLVYRVQPVKYSGSNGGGGDAGRISWKDVGGGQLEAVESNASPRLAHESLFSTFVPPDDTAGLAALRQRRASLDLLRSRSAALLPKLGAGDRQRMERHHEEISALENRIDELSDPVGACVPPPDPGEDPPLGEAHNSQPNGNLDYTEDAGYSDEDGRATNLFDLVHMALACDEARVAAVRMSFDQCFMNMKPLSGALSDIHEMSHGRASFDDFADGVGWHVKHFARLVAKLRDTQEFDGSSMLDHTAVVMMFEGGFGFDPEAGSNDSAHSSENMVALVAGGVGGLVSGQHIATAAAHPASVTLTAMQAVGADVGALGDIDQVIPELRV